MKEPRIQLEHVGDVAVITLSHPATLNAISITLVEELDRAIDIAVAKSRAILLTSRGRAFSSGGALNDEIATGFEAEPDFGAALETHVNPLMAKLRNLDIPWIAAVRGAAAGVGCSLALSADMVVASDTAYFMLAFSRVGLIPDGGCSHALGRSLSRVRMMELALLADRLPVETALAWGLINRIVPEAQLDEIALELAQRLAHGPTKTYGFIRKLSNAALDNDYSGMLAMERAIQRTVGRTADVAEGIAAFREKRVAQFTGQ